ncbi:ABC transporter ATP-binding protein [Rubrobacter aplysinae]|uniref:ABC transporter ATP-binding protein n=1 Tax=Rubrobacter aplysinae TaxID=909625 RepID=UPI00064C0EAB|nr:ABC transporter ATP-binding protein [Rubrobacter aplysinae]
METVIRVDSLGKTYGETVAVEEVSFEVGRGEIFGVVGPNGAGKTTIIECLTGMRSPDSGTVEVLGLNPLKNGDDLRRRIGVQLQQAALPDRLKVREALELYSTFYDSPADWRGLMDRWGLTEKRDTVFSTLSGGQQQRLFVALALLNDPEVVFLDELTSGLDPQARRASWDLVRDIRETGKTVVLVTHFMDEAETLCDRVAVVDRGNLVALDTPAALINGLHAESSLSFSTSNGFDPARLRHLPGVSEASRERDRIVVRGESSLLAPVAAELDRRGVAPRNLKMEQATLEDVFLTLTGREMRD